MKTAVLLAVVLGTHFGYSLLSDAPQEASWTFYVLRGIEGAVLFYLVSKHVSGLALVACWLGVFEEAQTAVCGMTAEGDALIPLWSGLCVEQYGPLPYAAFAVAALVYLICHNNLTRPPSPPPS